jgi:transcription antitermination factor NusG
MPRWAGRSHIGRARRKPFLAGRAPNQRQPKEQPEKNGMLTGGSLFDHPGFKRLARQYAKQRQPNARPVAGIDDISDGLWHVLRLMPGREAKAMRAVADRLHLGVYLPMCRERRFNYRGVRRRVERALFTGYGFVMVQNVGRYLDDIKACPCVTGVMMVSTESGQRIPATITDGLVRFIQACENAEDRWVAGELQDQQDELDASWRRDKNRRKPFLRRPPSIEMA